MKIKNDLIVLDIESTGVWVEKDKIIEIALIKCTPDGKKEIFHNKINPGISIPQVVVKLTGITNEHVIRKYCTPETVYYPVLALQQHTMLPETPLFRSTQDNQDFPHDIAAFPVKERQVLAAGKIFIESSTFQEIRDDEQGLAVGFPGFERGGITETRMKHPLYHVTAPMRQRV